MITIFEFFKGSISGSDTTIIDLYLCLRKQINVEFVLKLYNTDFKSLMNQIKKNLQDSPQKFVDRLVTDEVRSDTIITTTNTLRFLKKTNFKIYCNHLILLDTSQLYISYHNNYIDDMFDIKNHIFCDQITLLGNPSNKRFEQYVDKFIIHYHKFSINRLNHIEKSLTSIDKDLVTSRDINENKQAHMGTFKSYFNEQKIISWCDLTHLNISNDKLLPHGCNSYIYQRWIEVCTGIFVENIGKLIFEFCYLNKPVYYSPKNKTFNDGLHYYLKLFNIDDNKEQIINLSQEDILDKLVYNEHELIMDIL